MEKGQTTSPWDGLTNLESIDFTGIQNSTLGFNKDIYKSLKQITLSDQQLDFDLEGRWYYIDDNGKQRYLAYGNGGNTFSRVDKDANVYGKTIYKGDSNHKPGVSN